MKRILLIISIFFFMASSLFATSHHYVDGESGNDGDDGSSWANAWATIQHAADTVTADGTGHAYIHIAFSTYSPSTKIVIDINSGTNDSKRIIYDGDVENDSGNGAKRPIISGENITDTYTVMVSGMNYLIFQDLKFIKAYQLQDFFFYWFAQYNHVRRCIFDMNVQCGLLFYATAGGDNFYGKVYNNIFFNGGYVGGDRGSISLWRGARYVEIYNNTIDGSPHNGISLVYANTDNIYGTKIKNNTISNCSDYQIYVEQNCTDMSTNYNNYYVGEGSHLGYWEGTTEDTLSGWQNTSGEDANSVSGDPLFVVENGTYSITDDNSPCFNSGIDVSTITTSLDFNQDTREHWDLGAYYIETVEAAPEFTPQRRNFIMGWIDKIKNIKFEIPSFETPYAYAASSYTINEAIQELESYKDFKQKNIYKDISGIKCLVAVVYVSKKADKKIVTFPRKWDVDNPITRNGGTIGFRNRGKSLDYKFKKSDESFSISEDNYKHKKINER